ncbi:helix-turn-helix domain-containing protein [Mycobacterium kyogaense]|uniref:helix-turn-helix domain-containing protein n=1 Tax=Mycobacterium kyogaense TaxID=2212479 RepID=UPI003FA537C3
MTTWLTAADAAKYARVSTWTIRQAVMDGDLVAYALRTGRGYRLTAEDVDAWLRSNPYEPPSAR